ncbi:MAG: hypothetical protein HON76_04305 [Candidatus Scalindua sp.]|nr:hypothetical protein [Candidatus Scalindua sp.]
MVVRPESADIKEFNRFAFQAGIILCRLETEADLFTGKEITHKQLITYFRVSS